MELEFVEGPPPAGSPEYLEIEQALRARPGEWAKLPFQIPNQKGTPSLIGSLRRRGITVRQRTDPSGEMLTIYVMWPGE